MRSSALTALYVYTRSDQAVKRKKGPGQTVKSGFRAESSGQDRFQAVKNLDPGRERSYGKYWSDRPLRSLHYIVPKGLGTRLPETIPGSLPENYTEHYT